MVAVVFAGLDEYSNVAMEALKAEVSTDDGQHLLVKIDQLQSQTMGVSDLYEKFHKTYLST